MTPQTEPFIYSEARVAKKIGLTRGEIKYYRDRYLSRGRDWSEKKAGIALSLSGIKKIWRAMQNKPSTLDVSECTFEAPDKKKAALAPIIAGNRTTPVPMRMLVDRIYQNPYMVRATAHDTTFEVRVKSNLKLWVGLEIEAAPLPDHPPYYEMTSEPPRERRMVPLKYNGSLRANG